MSALRIGELITSRRVAMKTARNAKAYIATLTTPEAREAMAQEVREQVAKARTDNRIIVARFREWSGKPVKPWTVPRK